MEYRGAAGTNFFDSDALLRRVLEERLRPEKRERELAGLRELGALVGGRLAELIEAAHRDDRRPKLVRYDRWGERVDRVEYCAEQVEARRLALRAGPLPSPDGGRRLLVRMARAYLLNQNGEGGVTCPLAMTDGLVSLLSEHGTAEQKRRYLPSLFDPGVETPLTGGQFVTEKRSGSNVSENETSAEPAGGAWRLTGLKWFCSNPGELWVTTAKPLGSDRVALFLMPRRLPDGSLNEAHILRLKDLAGTRGKATAEVEYRGAYAELIGRPSHGMALLLRTVLKTSRIHVAAGSLGFMRRALAEAELYAADRRARGRPIAELPHVAAKLAELRALHRDCLLAFFEEVRCLEEGDPAADVLVPLLKIGISREASRAVREAQLIFAGHGILRDFSILPRLAEDALVQEIWEGTHDILAGHALKALLRPASRAAFEALLDRSGAAGLGEVRKELASSLEGLRSADESARLAGALAVCGLAFRAVRLAAPSWLAGRSPSVR